MKPNIRRKLGRRAFVSALGAATAAAPFLRLSSVSGDGTFPKRIVFFLTPNGTQLEQWWPERGCGLGTVLRPLEPLAHKITLLRGLDLRSLLRDTPPNHRGDFPNALTGDVINIRRLETVDGVERERIVNVRGAVPSVDQFIGDRVGGTSRFPILRVGVLPGGRSPFWSAPERAAPREKDPYRGFDQLFADFSAEPTAAERRRAERRSILDAVRGEAQALREAMPTEDRPLFESYIESVRDIERRLDPSSYPEGACEVPTVGTRLDVDANDNFPRIGAIQMDLVAGALACGMTRVACIQWHRDASGVVMNWVRMPGHVERGTSYDRGIADPHHMLSHRAGAPANAIETWYAEQFMHLATTLEGIREGDGTLLDNTCLIWLHEQQRGNHDRTDMPYVIAGSCGGFFRGGQCHDFGGIPHNRLLVSLCNAMDIDVDTYGDRSLSAGGALTGLR